MEDCIFCKIVRGEVSCEKVYEDESVLAFLDANPVSKGHLLVIPKKHYKDIFDIEEKVLQKIIVVAKKLALDAKEKLKAEGVNLINSNKKVAQQEVFHYHLHVVPRYSGDGLKLNWGRK